MLKFSYVSLLDFKFSRDENPLKIWLTKNKNKALKT